jgi:amino-acid N-acetyltransferase
MKAEKARIGDIPQIHKLVNRFAEKGEMLPRALSELYENIRDFFVVREGEQLVACAALHIFWSDLAEIRAVSVVEEMHDQGAGAFLVQACLEEAMGLGIETVFCLTYKPDFFEKCGFRQVDKMDLPRKVWGECQRCPKFPDCDEVALVYKLEHSG